MPNRRALAEWRANWPLVLTGVAGTTAVGAHVYPLGTVMKPLAEAYGWSRAEISTATTLSSFATMILATFLGMLLDRYGPRRVALIGTPLCAGIYALAGLAGPNIWSWFAVWAAYALVVLSILPIVWGKAIATSFHASRGLALAVGISGSGVAAAVYPPLTLWLLNTFGLRAVFPGIGLLMLVVLGPLVLFAFKARPVEAPKASEPLPPQAATWGVTLMDALRTSLMWRLVLVLGAAALTAASVNIHLQAQLTDGGLTPGQAATIAASLGPSVLLGRWVGGALLDRVHARWVTFVFYLAPAAGLLLLLDSAGDFHRALLATVMIGLSVGVEGDLLPFLLSRYFGLKHFGALYGFGMAVFGAGYTVGPTVAGLMFDRTGSYDGGLVALAVMLAAGGFLALTFGRYPDDPVEPSGDLIGLTPAPENGR